MSLGDLVVRVSANTAEFAKDIGKAAQISKKFQKNIKKVSFEAVRALGAISVASAGVGVAMLKTSLETADAMSKMAKSAGVTTESFTELAFAANLSGVEMSSMQTTIKRLNANVAEAVNGNMEFAQIFKSLGIEVENTDGSLKNADSVLNELSDVFSKLPDGVEKSALAIKLFGKGGSDIIPLLNEGSDGIARMRAEANELGLVMSGEAAASAELFNDNMFRLQSVVTGTATQFTTALLPSLVQISEEMVTSAKESGAMEMAVSDLVVVMKSLFSVGHGVAFVVEQIGKELGSFAAFAVEAASGDFTAAMNIVKIRAEEARTDLQKFGATSEKVWGDNADAQIEAQKKMSESNKKFSEEEKSIAEEKLRGAVRARKIDMENRALQKEAEKVIKSLKTETELYNDEVERLDALLKKGLLTQEQFNVAVGNLKPAIEGNKESITDFSNTTIEEMSTMEDSSKRFGSALERSITDATNGGKDSFKSLADFAIQELSRIAQEQISAQVSAQGGSFLSELFSSGTGQGFGDFFGGTSTGGQDFSALGPSVPAFANGGNPPVGVPSLVGERGPELFVPSTAGTIISNEDLRGAKTQSSPTVIIKQSISIGAGVDGATVLNAMNTAVQIAKADIMKSLIGGGDFASAVGRV